MEEYRKTGAEVRALGKEAGADFSFSKVGGKMANVLVLCKDRLGDDIEGVDTAWLKEEYIRTGNWPRVTVTTAWCAEGGSQDGKPYVCGGNFCFIYHSVSVMEGEENLPLDKHLSEVELAVKYQEAWDKLDSDIIAPYLDKDFHYGSAWVFDELPCRKEYLDYLQGKFNTIRRTMSMPRTAIARNRRTGGTAVVLIQNGNVCMLKLECNDGRIVSARMQEPGEGYEMFNPEDEIYQTHGDHIDAGMDTHRFMSDWMRKTLSDSVLWNVAFRKVYLTEFEGLSKVASLRYGEGPICMLSLAATDPRRGQNMFVSCFP